MTGVIIGYYAGCSLIAFVMYAVDKRAAQRGAARISERALNAWAMIGGFCGAIAGQEFLRHKSRKVGMVVIAWLAFVLHAAAWIWWLNGGRTSR